MVERTTPPEQAEAEILASLMRRLVNTPEWERFAQELGHIEMRTVQRMLTDSKEHFDYHRGVIQGLRMAYSEPERLIQRAQDGRQHSTAPSFVR